MTSLIEQQQFSLVQTIHWARQIERHLSDARTKQLGRVHFRPSSSGVAMVGLLSERPQRGKGGYRNLERLARDFDVEFRQRCVDIEHGRPTPEKRLQSWIVAEAYRHDRRLTSLVPRGDVTFIADELALAVPTGKTVCDLLALRSEGDRCAPVVIELETARQLTRLRQQVDEYAALVEQHLELFGELYSVVLGQEVRLTAPCEKWIVWPRLEYGREDPNAARLQSDGLTRVIGYAAVGDGYELG
jgi:hypothetical protein